LQHNKLFTALIILKKSPPRYTVLLHDHNKPNLDIQDQKSIQSRDISISSAVKEFKWCGSWFSF